MKLTFKMVGNSEAKTVVTVELQAPRYELTRDEMREWKEKMQDRVHELLRNDGYRTSAIRLVK